MRRLLTALLACATLTVSCAAPDGISPVGERERLSESAPTAVGIDSMFDAGSAVYSATPGKAHAIWSVALTQAQLDRDSLAQSKLHRWLGLAANRLSNRVEAAERMNTALSFAVALRDSAEVARVHHALSVIAYSEDRLSETAMHAELALRLAEAHGDQETAAKAAGNLGLVLSDFGELHRARTLIRRMQDYGATHGNRRMESNAIANLARMALWSGDPRSAMEALEAVRSRYVADEDRIGETNALGQMATAHLLQGEPGAALARLDTALVVARAAELEYEEVELQRLIAGVHAAAGDLPSAIAQYERALKLAVARDLPSEAAATQRQMSALHLALGNLDQARASGEAARAIHRVSEEIFQEFDDLLTLVQVEQQRGAKGRVHDVLSEARAIAAALDVPSAWRGLALAEASVADSRGDSRTVLAQVRIAEKHLLPGDYSSAVELHVLTARAYRRTGHSEQAISEWFRAIDAIERMRGSLTFEPWQRSLAANRGAVYADLTVALLEADRLADAFAVADRARSRGLGHGVVSADATGARVTLAVNPGDQKVDRLLEIDALLEQVEAREREDGVERGSTNATTNKELRQRLLAARNAYEAEFVLTSGRNSRETTIAGLHKVSMVAIQQALRPREALLLYLMTNSDVVVFVATHENTYSMLLGVSPVDIEARARVLRGTWGRPDSGWRVALLPARVLQQSLVQPALDSGWLKGIDQLVVVPHGILAQVPFAGLQSPASHRFLVEDFSLLQLPSASALAALRDGRRGSTTAKRAAAFAPFPKKLPFTLREAESVGTRVAHATVHRGVDADERSVRQALQRDGLVHIASHATLNANNPLFSRVELARPRRSYSGDDNGRLEVHELLGLRIRSRFVFLSGCETGRSAEWLRDPVLGVDHLTLLQAFLYAGAQNVTGTLWRIDDDGAAALAAEFYRALDSRGPAEAMAVAQRKLLRSARHVNPYYWAGYVVAGSNELGVQ